MHEAIREQDEASLDVVSWHRRRVRAGDRHGRCIFRKRTRIDAAPSTISGRPNPGHATACTDRAEISSFCDHVALWADRVTPEAAHEHPEAARFPYLGPGFELVARDAGAPASIASVHVFNWGATMSHGAIAGDIPGLGIGALRLADAIVKRLFVEDAARHWQSLVALDEPELKPTRYYVPR